MNGQSSSLRLWGDKGCPPLPSTSSLLWLPFYRIVIIVIVVTVDGDEDDDDNNTKPEEANIDIVGDDKHRRIYIIVIPWLSAL